MKKLLIVAFFAFVPISVNAQAQASNNAWKTYAHPCLKHVKELYGLTKALGSWEVKPFPNGKVLKELVGNLIHFTKHEFTIQERKTQRQYDAVQDFMKRDPSGTRLGLHNNQIENLPPAFAIVKVNKKTVLVGDIKLNDLVIVVGRYVDNTDLTLTSGQTLTTQVLRADCVLAPMH